MGHVAEERAASLRTFSSFMEAAAQQQLSSSAHRPDQEGGNHQGATTHAPCT